MILRKVPDDFQVSELIARECRTFTLNIVEGDYFQQKQYFPCRVTWYVTEW